jgi:hypothetical protein
MQRRVFERVFRCMLKRMRWFVYRRLCRFVLGQRF